MIISPVENQKQKRRPTSAVASENWTPLSVARATMPSLISACTAFGAGC
jgi:hypothetical protein